MGINGFVVFAGFAREFSLPTMSLQHRGSALL